MKVTYKSVPLISRINTHVSIPLNYYIHHYRLPLKELVSHNQLPGNNRSNTTFCIKDSPTWKYSSARILYKYYKSKRYDSIKDSIKYRQPLRGRWCNLNEKHSTKKKY